MQDGILPEQDIRTLAESGAINADRNLEAGQIQPASLDLRLDMTAYRLRASFLPGAGRTVSECLDDVAMHKIDLTDGAVLETGCVYLVPLTENLKLPKGLSAAANPKSSTGRLDVFTRVICDGADSFDGVPDGYNGPLYVEIAPRTFSVLAKPGDRLVQIRFRRGQKQTLDTQTVSIDLEGADGTGIVGWRARRHAGLVDIGGVGAHTARDFWEPLSAPDGMLVLDPDEFYILASKEAVTIPDDRAAEMAPIAPEIGEFRAHYAGFFDPGFGMAQAGGTNVAGADDALAAIAHKAMERKTGARGLRSIVEGVLLDTMYELPSMDDVSKVVIDETVIKGESDPILIYENNKQDKAASE